MTINIIETMKQALEALEYKGLLRERQAKVALRAAIEQMEKQEPVAYAVINGDRVAQLSVTQDPFYPHSAPLYTHPAPAAPCPKCEEAADKALKYATKYEELVQAITDPENQPSQYGTVLMSNAPALPEDAAKDAERYRWLRKQTRPEDFYSGAAFWEVSCVQYGMGLVLRNKKLDAAIDVAMKVGADKTETT